MKLAICNILNKDIYIFINLTMFHQLVKHEILVLLMCFKCCGYNYCKRINSLIVNIKKHCKTQ